MLQEIILYVLVHHTLFLTTMIVTVAVILHRHHVLAKMVRLPLAHHAHLVAMFVNLVILGIPCLVINASQITMAVVVERQFNVVRVQHA